MIALEPALSLLARGSPVGRLKQQEDAVRDIMVRVLEKLRAGDRALVREIASMPEPPNLRAWLRVLVRRVAIDYMRTRQEYRRAYAPDDQPGWISLVSLSTGAGAAVTDSVAEKRAQVLSTLERDLADATAAFARRGEQAYGEISRSWGVPPLYVRRLLGHGDRYASVLNLLFQGYTYREIGTKLDLSRRKVELVIRHAEELLRARYRTSATNRVTDGV